MPDTAALTHARILTLLETVEEHERARRPLVLDALGATPQRAAAEIDWLASERLATFDVLGGDPALASRLGPGCLVSRDGLERSGFMRARDLEALDPGLGGAGEVEEAVV